MKFHTEYVTFNTRKEREYINVTDKVEAAVKASGCREGMVLVSAMHITAAVYVNDAEQGLIQDIDEWLETLAPRKSDYRHHRTGETQWRQPPEEPPHRTRGDPSHHRWTPRPGPVAAGVLRGVRRQAAQEGHHQGHGRVEKSESTQVRRQLGRGRAAHQGGRADHRRGGGDREGRRGAFRDEGRHRQAHCRGARCGAGLGRAERHHRIRQDTALRSGALPLCAGRPVRRRSPRLPSCATSWRRSSMEWS